MDGYREASVVHGYGGADDLRDALADRVTHGACGESETLVMALLYVGDRLAELREATREAGGLQPRPVTALGERESGDA